MSKYDDEKEIINALKNKDNGSSSMRVIGRGTLVMSAKDVKSSEKYKSLLNKADSIVVRK